MLFSVAQAFLPYRSSCTCLRLGHIDRSLVCLDLTEERSSFALVAVPVINRMANRCGGSNVPSYSLLLDPFLNSIDELVLFNSVLSPAPVEGELLAICFGLSDGNKARTAPSFFEDVAGDPFVCEAKMVIWFCRRRIDDGIFYDGFAHSIVELDWFAASSLPLS